MERRRGNIFQVIDGVKIYVKSTFSNFAYFVTDYLCHSLYHGVYLCYDVGYGTFCPFQCILIIGCIYRSMRSCQVGVKCASPISAPPLSLVIHSQGERGTWFSPLTSPCAPSSLFSSSVPFPYSVRSHFELRLSRKKLLSRYFSI